MYSYLSLTRYEILYFMDCWSGFHSLILYVEEKTPTMTEKRARSDLRKNIILKWWYYKALIITVDTTRWLDPWKYKYEYHLNRNYYSESIEYIWKRCSLDVICLKKKFLTTSSFLRHCFHRQKPITVKPSCKLWPDKADHTNEEVMRAATCGEKVTEEG